MAEAERQAAAAGATVYPIDLPAEFDALLAAQHTIMAYELARTLAFEFDTAPERISAELGTILDEGRAIPACDYARAQQRRRVCQARLDEVFAQVDALIAPSAPGEAPRRTEGTGDPVFNRIWTLLGTPCVNVPGLTGANGLPVGVQVIGALHEDAYAVGRALAGSHAGATAGDAGIGGLVAPPNAAGATGWNSGLASCGRLQAIRRPPGSTCARLRARRRRPPGRASGRADHAGACCRYRSRTSRIVSA